MPKKRSISQKIGELGEDIFQLFARERGLIPTKIPNDYGIDFICQRTTRLKDGKEDVLPSPIGVNVKSSNRRRIRTQYSRDDIELILRSDFPILLVIVDVGTKVVYHRFLDIELLEFFHDELAKGSRSITMTPAKMNNDDESFCRSISQVTKHKYEKIRIRGIELRLSQIIGPARLRIQRSCEGSLALIEVRNFEDIFKYQEDEIKSKVREIILTSRLNRGFWLPTERINRAIANEMGDFAEKIAVITKIPSKPEKLIVKNDENVVECFFEVRPLGDEFSFYHISGLSIIFSGPRNGEDGQYHHNFEVRYYDQSSEPIFDNKDIVEFLKNCKENATLYLGDVNRTGIELKYFPMLIRLGLIVSSLEKIYAELKIARPLVKLFHIDVHNFLITYGFIDNLFDQNKQEDIWPGFIIAPEEAVVTWVRGKIFCPVFLTLPEGVFITLVSFQGKIGISGALGEEDVVGFRFDKYLGMDVEEFNEAPDKPIQLPKLPLMLVGGTRAIEIMELREGGFNQVKSPIEMGISYVIDE